MMAAGGPFTLHHIKHSIPASKDCRILMIGACAGQQPCQAQSSLRPPALAPALLHIHLRGQQVALGRNRTGWTGPCGC